MRRRTLPANAHVPSIGFTGTWFLSGSFWMQSKIIRERRPLFLTQSSRPCSLSKLLHKQYERSVSDNIFLSQLVELEEEMRTERVGFFGNRITGSNAQQQDTLPAILRGLHMVQFLGCVTPCKVNRRSGITIRISAMVHLAIWLATHRRWISLSARLFVWSTFN